ncbi:MAG: PaaI family thioesterase [Actinomycetota bacterium]
MSTIDDMRTEEIWKQEYRGGYPDPRVIALSGLDNLRRGLELGGPRPPMSHLTGLLFAEVDQDHATFEMSASDWFLSSQEQISVGPLMMLADAALGCGVMINLPPLTPYTTAELSMTFLKPCRPGGTLRATGVPLYEGNPLSISQTWIEDGHGDRVAFGSSSCYVLPPLQGIEPPTETERYIEPQHELPDPHMRETSGATIPWDVWQTMNGLEILQKQIAGELPKPPIHYLTGLTLREATHGASTFSMPASRWLTSPLGTVQGGCLAMLAHAALATAVTTTLDTGAAYRPVDVKVNFLRPCFPTGDDLIARGAVTHRGRTLAIATADVVGADGKKIVTATGSTMILPSR